MRKCGKYQKREEEMAGLEKVTVNIRTQVQIKNTTIADEAGEVTALETELRKVCRSTAIP
jgi:hypothetical protein